jgi:hypothetical protein
VHESGVALLAVRLAVIVAIATVSAYLVELPVRRGRLSRWPVTIAMPAAASLAVLTVFVSTVEVSGASAVSHVTASAPNLSLTRPAPSFASSASPSSSPAGAPGAPGAAGSPSSQGLFAAPRGEPVKVLVVGDSVAGTLGVGLGRLSAQYGVVAVNEGRPGCSVSMDQLVQVLWFTGPPGTPCRQGDPAALLAQWRAWVDQWNPDVVIYMARGDVLNQQVNANWQHIGDSSFDTYLAGRYQEAVSVLGSRGAHVIMLTSPFYDTGVQPSGAIWPEDDPGRVVGDNFLIDEVASLRGSATAGGGTKSGTATTTGATTTTSSGTAGPGPAGGSQPSAALTRGGVTVIDVGRWLSPGGRYSGSVDGVQVRCADGVHLTLAGSEWVARRLLPEIVTLGRAHQAVSPSGWWSGDVAQVPPPWFTQLPCTSA